MNRLDHEMQSSLLSNDEFVVESPQPATYSHPVVVVIAPESLSEGYTFDVEVNREILTVMVPHGGVAKGQKFHGQTQAQIQNERKNIRIPVGGWKDGLFDFCRFGPMHPSVCCAVCCPLIALGQIYTRLNLNWHGQPNDGDYGNNSNGPSSRAFKTMVGISVLYGFLVRFIVFFNPAASKSWIHFSGLLFLFFCGIFIGRTRTQIRNRYEIQATLIEVAMERSSCRNLDESLPFGCDVVEDYCVSFVCAPCAVSQMSRHTASYETYGGSYFSSNGMPPHAPIMV